MVKKEETKPTDLYLYATEQIAKHFENQDVTIVIVARRDTRKSYNQNILDIYAEHNLKATFSDPAKDKSLQIADFYSWSIFSHYEKSNSDYFNKLSGVIKLLK